MIRRSKKTVLEGVVFLLLLCGAMVLWGRKEGWFGAGSPGGRTGNAGRSGNSQAEGAAGSSNRASTSIGPWATRQPALAETGLVVLPTSDRSGLVGSWNFEIRETAGRMIQAMMDLGGRPVSCPESWPLYAALKRNGYSFTAMKILDDAALARLGKALKTKAIVQVDLKWETDKTVARAKAVESETGRVLGQWEASVPGTSRSYEALFDVQCALAPKVAAGLIGVPEDDLLSGKSSTPASEADRHAARDLSDEALRLFDPCTYPRAMRALRMALDALKRDKRCVDAWMVVSLASLRLSDQAADTETNIWREMMMRSVVAGEMAMAIDLSNPKARYARACSLAATGRFSELIRMMRKAAKEAPAGDWLTRSAAALFLNRRKDFPDEPKNLTPGEKALYNHLVARSRFFQNYDERQAVVNKWLDVDPLAPYLWYDSSYKGLNETRLGHTFCSIQGSVLCLAESLRQLELHGKTDAIPAVFQNVGPEFLKYIKEIEADKSTSGSVTPLADGLESRFRQWVAKEGQAAWDSVGWESDSLAMKLFNASQEARRKALDALGTPMPLLRGPGSGVDLSSPLWLDLADRPALDGAKESFADIAWKYGDEQSALAMATEALQSAPDDLGMLEAVCYYYRNVNFHPRMVDQYQQRMLAVDFTYGPLRRRGATFTRGSLKDKIDAIEKLKYYGPFHFKNLAFIVDQLDSLGADDQAADYAHLLLVRYPLDHHYRFQELYLRARAEKRLITDSEIQAVEDKIPEEYKGRDLDLANAYRRALDMDKAIALYEKIIKDDPPHTTGVYYNVSWLHRLKGEPEKAVDDLLNYIKLDPNSLAACDVWLEISWIRYAEGDLKRAEEDLQQAEAVESWKGSVILRRGFMDYVEGNVSGAISEYQRNATRYPMQYSYTELGWAMFASGNIQGAMQCVDQGLQANPGSDIHDLRATLLRAQGKDAEAEQALEGYNGRLIDDADPQILLASHELAYGNAGKALAHAQEAMRRCIDRNRRNSLNVLALAYIMKGDLRKAEDVAKEIRARLPLNLTGDYLLARIALARNNPQEAERILGRSVKARAFGGLHLVAKAEFMEKKFQQAYDHVKLGNSMMLVPAPEWLLLEGDAAKAIGKTDEAKKAWKRCLDTAGPNTKFGKQAAKRLGGS